MIRKGNISDFKHLITLAKKERVALSETKSEVNYLVYEIDGEVIGFVGYSIGKLVRLKSDFVHPAHRGKGIYRALFEARLERLSKYRFLDAFCTPLSLNTYLAYGFKSVRVSPMGITYVTKENL